MLRYSLLTIFLILTIACAPTKKEIQISAPPQKPKEIPASLSVNIPLEKLADRINALNMILEKKDLSEEKKKEIIEIIDTYNIIKEMGIKGHVDQNSLNRLVSLLVDSFYKIEGKYVLLLQKKPEDISGIMEKLAQKKEKIIQDYKGEKYTDVVNQCLELKLKYGGEILDPGLDTIFAISLAKIGMIREAVETGKKALQQWSFIPEKNFLQDKIKEWEKSLEEAEVPAQEKEEKKKEEVNTDIIIINAKRLIEQDNFEQALSILNESGIENNKEIDELKEKAIEGIINRERNKAARLFLLAKESNNIEEKKQYLETAYRILEALIIQYPESPLINRIKENLRKVSEELNALSPAPNLNNNISK